MRVGVVSADRISPTTSPDGLEHWGGAGWVRLGQYLPYFGNDVIVGTLVWHKTEFKILNQLKEMHDVDIIIMQRLMHEGLTEHVKLAKQAGQIVINDVDDWYWGLDPSNMAYHASHPKTNKKENTNYYRSIISESSLVTTSTPFLYEKVKVWNKNVILLPNTVDIKTFKKHDHTINSNVTIGWSGSTAHRSKDLQVLNGVLSSLDDTTTQISYLHAGHYKGSPHFADEIGLSKEKVKTLPICDPQDYPTMLQMDIGIAPLRDCSFNHAKSEIKLLEYSASGIPWVASALPSYTSLVKEFGMGRTAKRTHDWIRNLKQLVASRSLRQDEGERLYELVKKRDVSVGGAKWREVLSQFSA